MKEDGATRTFGFIEILSPDGSVERAVGIEAAVFELGQTAEGLAFPDDAQMADRQARLYCDDDSDRVWLEDLGVGSGVWLRIEGAKGHCLAPGDQLWLGAQIVVVRKEGDLWSLDHHGPSGAWCATYSIPPEGSFLGRSSDIVLDANDPQLSRRHAQVVPETDGLRAYDRGAHNGSFLRVTTPESIEDGTEFRIAGQRLRFAAAPDTVPELSVEPEPEPEPELESKVESDQREPFVVTRPDGLNSVDEEPAKTPEALPISPVPEMKEGGGLASRLRRLGRRGAANSTESAPPAEPGEESESKVADPVTPPPPLVEEATVVYEVVPTDEEATIIAPFHESEPKESTALPESEDAPLVDPVLVVIDSKEGSVSLTVAAGKTVLDAVREAGLTPGDPVDWECGDGGCGVCVVGVVEGADRMDPPDPAGGEMKTIQITEQVAPDPKLYRLACLARVRGPVRLRKLT